MPPCSGPWFASTFKVPCIKNTKGRFTGPFLNLMNKFNKEMLACMEYFHEREAELLAELESIINATEPVRSQFFRYPVPCRSIERQARLYKWLVRPMLAAGVEFVRMGGRGDGGYVMPDPGENGVAYSLGIADAVSWDLDMAARGFEVWQYDGSVDAPPVLHPAFHFEKSFIGGTGALPEGWRSLENILRENGHAGRDDLVLQIDIEGSEWDVFTALGEAGLRSFRQIIVELHLPVHDLMLLPLRNAVLRLLNLTHQAVHVHVNNGAPVLELGKETLWTVIEVTYLRRDAHQFSPSPFSYPLELDAPCHKLRIEPRPGKWGLMELL